MGHVFDGLAVGDVVATRDVPLTRDSLVRYAGASGDFNPIHYRDDIAQAVGLPGVLAHGMLTMGLAVSPVVEWLGDAGVVQSYQVRFTKPVVVDARTGAGVSIPSKVRELLVSDTCEVESVRLDLQVTSGEVGAVLGKAQVVVTRR